MYIIHALYNRNNVLTQIAIWPNSKSGRPKSK